MSFQPLKQILMICLSWKGIIFIFVLIAFFGCQKKIPEEVLSAYATLPDRVDYNFHIKPILSDRCYTCHGPDPETRKAGLRLDIEEEAFGKLESGKRAFVKGKIGKSEVIHRLMSSSPDQVMPPPESELTMSNEEIALIAKWIEQGAEWKEHWSFLPIEKPSVPELNNDWVQYNPIDHFIQSELKVQGLSPSVEADKERLIKRLTMDLTGLPPSIQDVDNFINDQSFDAYEHLVDRLLSSTAHAERMTQDWMDVARYSDSHGVSFDGYRTSWPYRDWLIHAFEKNMSYKDFITHQVAGDLIENSDEQSKIATSFLRMNPMEASGGSIPEEFRVEYVNERAGMIGISLMGLTLECAKCHDHKFDPITQKEFYQVAAFFNNTIEYGLAPTDSDRPPTLILLDDLEKSKIDSFISAIDQQEEELISTTAKNKDQYNKTLPKKLLSPPLASYQFDKIEEFKKEKKNKDKKNKKKEYEDIQILDGNKDAEANLAVSLTEGKFDKAAFFGEEYDIIKLRKIGEFEHTQPFSVSSWVKTSKDSAGVSQHIIGNSGNVFEYHRGWDFTIDSFNMINVKLIHRLPDEYISVKSTEPVEAHKWVHLGFTYDGSRSAQGIKIFKNGKEVETKIVIDNLKRSIIPIELNSLKPDSLPLVVGKSNRPWMHDLGMFQGAIDEIKVFDRQISHWEMGVLGEANLDPDESSLKMEHWSLNDPLLQSKRKQIQTLREQLQETLDNAEEVMVMEEMKTPRKTYVLDKGLYNQYKEEVRPGGVAKVLPYDDNLPQNRLGLSQWLFDEKNPLVARVAVNRYWMMIFGRGLVTTAEDFGSQGTRPSHPELLDWLAKDFIDHEWDIRNTIKQMVMSYTYRQSSFSDPGLREKDPENIYLARSPSYRLPAEMIRDNALKASGLLAASKGGPSVRPYQPDGLWKEILMASPKLGKYNQQSGDSLYRRSMYTFSRRFAPAPMMINFDATPREICTIRRNTTNTPLQALTLLNDPQFVEASRVLSEKVLSNYPDDPKLQIEMAFRQATSLRPSNDQLDILNIHYFKALEKVKEEPAMIDSLLCVGEYPIDLSLPTEQTAALTLVVNTIFNFDESYMKR